MVSGSYHDFCGPTGNSGEASRNQGEKEESLYKNAPEDLRD
jgi:hypothetical protein